MAVIRKLKWQPNEIGQSFANVVNETTQKAIRSIRPLIIYRPGRDEQTASTGWEGVASGRYPSPFKLGPRISAWRLSDINRVIEQGAISQEVQHDDR